jgi:hypothetical protein
MNNTAMAEKLVEILVEQGGLNIIGEQDEVRVEVSGEFR